jgi:hypothetical protein
MTNEITITISEMNRYEQLLSKINFGQSVFQDTYFNVQKEYTPHRKLRQVLLEYDQLCHTLISNQFGLQKTAITKAEKEEDIKDNLKLLDDPRTPPSERVRINFSIQRLEIELQEIDISIVRSKKLINDAIQRKENFERLLAELVPQVESLEESGIDFEKAEEIYWGIRLTENAQLDNISAATNRTLDKENLRSILKLPVETRQASLKIIGCPDMLIQELDKIANQDIETIFLAQVSQKQLTKD